VFDLLDGARPALTARIAPAGSGGDGAGGYRGAENRLYRIEIHAPGTAGAATFRWSRDNGAPAPAANERPVVERTAAAERWIALEDGIEIQFAANGCYRCGDYWTVPARPAIRGCCGRWRTTASRRGRCRRAASACSARRWPRRARAGGRGG
jgi:hypothetical protein